MTATPATLHHEDTLESKIERDACTYAELRGWFQAKFVSPGKRGVPDRIFIRRGRVIFIEFKKAGETLRPQQVKRVREMREHGAEVFVCDNLEEAKGVLR